MLMFLILCLPLFITVYCLKTRTKKVIPVIFIGFFSAVLVVAFKMLFLLSHRIIRYSLSDNLFYYLIKESFLPVVVIYVLYFLISKDNIEFKINTYLPLELSFYAVYLPYCVISTTSSAYSLFSIFVKPVIYALMIAQTGVSLRDLYRGLAEDNKNKVIINSVIILFYLIFPALIESIYVMNYNIFIFIIVTLIYIIIPVFLFLINKKIILNKSDE